MQELFLIVRYLRKRRLAILGSLAVGLCVALLIVITSLFDGFIHSLHNYWREAFGEVSLLPGRMMHDYDGLANRLREVDGVAAVRVTNSMGALLYLGRGDLRGVELQGITAEQLREDPVFRDGLILPPEKQQPSAFALTPEMKAKAKSWLEKRRQPTDEAHLPTGAIPGIGLLDRPDEKTDTYDREKVRRLLRERTRPVTIISGKYRRSEGEAGAAKIQEICWPVNAVQTGISFSDKYYIYVPFDYLRDLIGVPDELGRMQCLANVRIFLTEDTPKDQTIPAIEQAWHEFAREQLGWSEQQIGLSYISDLTSERRFQMLTGAITQQLYIMQLLIGLICIVVALLVFVILFMMVMQKKKDIGILRAIGAGRGGIARMFLGYGAGIGVGGALLGLALGVWATHNIALLERTLSAILGFKIWSSGVYLFSEIPNDVAWPSVGWIMAVGALTAMLGSLLPAIRAANMQPVDTLRYE